MRTLPAGLDPAGHTAPVSIPSTPGQSRWGHGLGYSLHDVLPCTDEAYDGSRVAALPIQEALAPVRIMRLRLRRGATRPAVQAFRSFLDRAFNDVCPE